MFVINGQKVECVGYGFTPVTGKGECVDNGSMLRIESGRASEHELTMSGSLYFQTGAGIKGPKINPRSLDGSFIFSHLGTERFRIDPDGSVHVNGDKVTSDRALYEAFRRWLAEATAHMGPDAYRIGT